MTEFFSSFPGGYKRGKTKYIVVTGSVMSGVGKGTLTASLATLLQLYDLKVSMIKFDGYLNVDAGTLNPYRHGEVFVLDDGTETDLDLGTYERALHRNLSKYNYLTSGKIFKTIIEKERKGLYLGRDVQFIPHVTGEIKKFIRTLSIKDNPDIIIIEIGGTLGDLENSYFVEAMRQLQYEEGKENVSFINVTYIIEPPSLNEQKSKAAQLGVTKLMSLGIKPDFVVCRATKPIKQNIKEKISLVSDLPPKNIISLEDFSSIYEVPFYLMKQKTPETLLNLLNLRKKLKKQEYHKWLEFLKRLKNPKQTLNIAITGKYTGVHDSYLSILKALEHASIFLQSKLNISWIETTDLENKEIQPNLMNIDGIIVPGGFGARGSEGKIKVIEKARKENIPFLGLCFGFQLAIVEFARNICNLDACSSEIGDCKDKVIDLLPEQKQIKQLGGTMRLGARQVIVKKNSIAYNLYKKDLINERFRHRYEVNPKYIKTLENNGLIFSGYAKENNKIMQILELKSHNFFLATQFHPELLSKPLIPHPLFLGFISACMKKNKLT